MAGLVRCLTSRLVFSCAALLFAAFPISSSLAATNSGITYHGRVLKPDGTPLENKQVQFKVQIRSPGSEDCLMYEELQTRNMLGSAGVFSITLNDGSGTRTDGNSYNIDSIFSNRGSFSFPGGACATGTTYNTNAADGRVLVMYFKSDTMATWEQLPSQSVNFSPLAIEAKQIGGFKPANLLRVDDSAAALNSTPFTSTQFNSLLDLVNGTSTKYVVNSSSSGASIPSFAGSPSTLSAGSMWYDSGSNQLKYYDGTSVQTLGAGGGGGSGTVTSITVGTGLVDGSGNPGTVFTTSGTIALPAVGTAGTYYKVTTDTQGRVSAGAAALVEADIPTLTTAGKVSGNTITSGTIAGTTAIATSGNIQTSGDITGKRIFVQDNGSNYASFKAPAAVTSTYSLTLPTALPGSNCQVLVSDTSGNLTWSSPSSGSVTSVGASSPLSNTGTASDPVIAIQVANGTQNGYLSSGDWTTFNSKLGTSLTSGNLWVGNGSNTATAVAPSGDVSMTNAGAFTVAKVQGVAVSATAPTTAGQVLRYDGASSYVAAQLGTSDISGLSTALSGKIDASQMPANCAANQTLTFSSPTGTWACSNISITGSAFGSQTQNLVLASPDGSSGNPSFRALASGDIPSLDAAKITSGTLPITRGGTGSTTGSITGSGALTFAAGGTNQDITLSPSGTGNTLLGGNVGIGTTTPGAKLDVNGEIRLQGSTSGYVGLKAPATAPSLTWTLPTSDSTGTQFLQSDGSGNLSWGSPAGSGTVNSGTANQLAYYSSTGSAVSGLTTANNGVLITNGSGVPSIASTLPTAVQGNITSLGTITSGTWNGSAIGAQYGGTGLTSLASNSLLYGNGTGAMNALAPVNSSVLTSSAGGVPQWSTIASDTFTQYALLAGRSGGQNLNGGTAASENLTLDSTANTTKGNVLLAPNGGNVGIGTTSPVQKLTVAAGSVQIDDSTGASPGGIIYKGTAPFIHNFNYGNNGSVTTDGKNTFIGKNAGNLTMGSTGLETRSASYNTGVGENALTALTTGWRNTAVGSNALAANTTYYENTAIGAATLSANTTGYQNTAVGAQALGANTGGLQNTALGVNALSATTTGRYNIGVGFQALYSNNQGFGNVAVGINAGFDLNTTWAVGNNTFIGTGTGLGITTGINNTIIGANVSALPAALSNNIIIADGNGNRRINVDSSGNVGIGTTTPGAKLEVASGVANTSGLKFTNFTSTAPTSTGQPVGVDASGNLVTISVSGSGTVNSGTANQLAFYSSTGSAVSGNANVTATNGAMTLGQTGSVVGSLSLSGNTSGTVTIAPQAAAGTYNFNLPTTAGTSGQVLTSAGGGASAMTWSTLATSATTDATNASNISSGTLNVARLPTVTVPYGGTGLTSLATNSLLYGNGTGNMNALAPANSSVLTSTAGGVPQWSTIASDTFTQYALLAGRSGGQTLNGGTAASENLTLDSTANATKGNILLAPDGGNVGIGTSSPSQPLHIVGAKVVDGGLNSQINVRDTSAYNASPRAGLKFGVIYDSSNNAAGIGGIMGGKENAVDGDYAGYVSIFTRPTAGGNTERLRVTSTGSVGIGTTSPGAMLDVNGSSIVRGAITGIANLAGSWPTYDPSAAHTSYVIANNLTNGTAEVDFINTTSLSGGFRFYQMTGAGAGTNLMTLTGSGNIGIGTPTPAVSLDFNGKTDAIRLPAGTTAQQPASPAAGMFRYNSTNSALEYHNGSSWQTLSVGGAGSYLSTSGGTLSGALTISSGGASITGGINNNSGGITNTGSITGVGANITGSGAMTVAAGGTNQNLSLNSSGTGAVNVGSANGTSLSVLDGGASTVNYVTVKGAATGGAPTIATAGSDANINLTITPKGTGNVGIGTTTPSSLLHVSSASTTATNLTLENTDTGGRMWTLKSGGSAGTGGAGVFKIDDTTAAATRLAIDTTGKVGIGTSTPSHVLHVGTTGFNTRLGPSTAVGGGSITGIEVLGQREDANSTFGGRIGLPLWRTDTFVANGTALGQIRFGGNHTDGTLANVAYPASIVGYAEGDFNSSTDMPVGISFRTSSTGRGLSEVNTLAGTERMRITNAGNVGIGTSAPIAKLQVNATLSHATGSGFGVYYPLSFTPTTNPDSTTFAYGNYTGTTTGGTADLSNALVRSLTGGVSHNTTSNLNQAIGIYGTATNNSTGTVNASYGVYALSNNGAGGDITTSVGVHGRSANPAGGTISSAFGLQASVANFGTGTITNSYGLQVQSPVNSGGGTLTNFYGLYINTPSAATNNYAIFSQGGTNYFGGNVGIGTTAPQNLLTVAGGSPVINIASTGTAGANQAILALTTLSDGNALGGAGNLGWQVGARGNAYSTAPQQNDFQLNYWNGTSWANYFAVDSLTGSIGVGLSAPSAALHLKAGAAAAGGAPLKLTAGTSLTTPEDGALEFDGTDLFFTSGGTRRTLASSASGTTNLSTIANPSGSITMTPSSGNSVLVNSSTASTSSTSGALIVNGGAGIGGALNVGGSITADTALYSPSIYGGTSASGNLTIDSTSNASKGNILLAPSGGNVGIGTTTPTAKLEIYGTGQTTAALTDAGSRSAILAINANAAGAGNGGAITFGNSQSVAAGSLGFAAIKGLLSGGTGNTVGEIAFSTRALSTDTALTERARLTYTGNFGIGTSTPSGKFEVKGGKSYLTNTTASADAAWSHASMIARDDRAFAQYVGGGITFEGQYDSSANYSTYGWIRGFKSSATDGDFKGGMILATRNGNMIFQTKSAAGTIDDLSTATSMVIDQTGNVGIGTTSPSQKLEVTGTIFSNSAAPALRLNETAASADNKAWLVRATGEAFMIQALDDTGSGGGKSLKISRSGNQFTEFQLSNGASNPFFKVDMVSGNVGIGTTSPLSNFQVTGTGTDGKLPFTYYDNDSASSLSALAPFDSATSLGWNISGGFGESNFINRSTGVGTTRGFTFVQQTGTGTFTYPLRIEGTTGNVGIGTTAPGVQTSAGRGYLSISGSSSAGFVEFLTAAADADLGSLGGLQFTDKNSVAADKRAALIAGNLSGSTANNRGGALSFYTKANGTSGLTSRMTISSDGNVGIGTASPGYKLDVSGGDVNIGSGQYYRISSAGVLGYDGTNAILRGASGKGAQLVANDVPVLTAISSGNVGIGTTTPSSTLQVAGTTTTTNATVTGNLSTTQVTETAVNLGASLSGTVTLNLANGTYFHGTVSGATTFAVSNAASAGQVSSFTLELTNGGSQTLTWMSGTKWPGGTAPTFTASGVDLIVCSTRDGGTVWRCVGAEIDSK